MMHPPTGRSRRARLFVRTHRYELGVTTVRVVVDKMLELDVVIDLGRGIVGAHWLLSGRPVGPALIGLG